ncbi:hypothetical protein F5Y13DRAFT_199538 [Hypoxylon sp. FL1857]|nr:hypothetical protein F5Y13DRAFT_199538 [Hypoxylon sp. FL1857]
MSDTSLDEEIAAYKQQLGISTDKSDIDLTCNQLRFEINKLLDNGIVKKVEFCRAIGNPKSFSTCLTKRGSMEGKFSCVYTKAWAWSWFKQRELAGLNLPNVKKRQKTEAAAAAVSSAPSSGARSSTTSNTTTSKINVHLQTPGLTAVQFCRYNYAQLKRPKVKSFQSKQLSDFRRKKKGVNARCTSQVFYAAYVYFEKNCIAEGKPKSQHHLSTCPYLGACLSFLLAHLLL